jgi:hypothetical protein
MACCRPYADDSEHASVRDCVGDGVAVPNAHGYGCSSRAAGRACARRRRLGKRFAYTYEVVGAQADAFVEMKVTQPFPMHVRYELEPIDASTTKVAIHARGDARGFFKLMSPIMNRMVRRNIRRDLEALASTLTR